MEVDRRTGAVVRYEMHDGVIHSHARMTYTEVNAILTDRDPAVIERYRPLVPMFERMHELFEILNARRRRRGSIDFDLKESRDRARRRRAWSRRSSPSERNVAHRLIEEFMLLANETVAAHLETHSVPTLYRVHEEPDPAKVEDLRGVHLDAGLLAGRRRPTSSTPRDFQRLVEKIHGKPEEKPIAFLMLRTMQKARYDPANLGHFGLAAPSLHALHVADPPLSRTSSCTASLRESRARHERRAPRGAGRGPAGDRAPHVGARAPRQRRRARARAVEESPVHGRQGRRRVRRLRHRRQRVRPLHRARRALRRGHGARLDHGRRLLPVRRARARAARREERPRVPARRSRATCR